ncbi:hypothetical protein PCO18_07110 [Streptococcus suis]|uniref:hypothetical protein n=1 Tax=Streptococcus suis TaxID=1307 RepID=UPI0002B78C59|nr:hypothetical protein [Streptococcus suis]AGF87670.1 hypothetical protein phiS10_0021 [Streptococcus phage phiS10]MDG3160135.1 hypothetical protein [Streptococcus suis]MDG3240660.1 hypothetical protein [Streptococcus suis]MDN2973155.1 hypothetical protein [Streptococcus suis]MDN2982697.1 hypothetical protein [Streptococcus suis]
MNELKEKALAKMLDEMNKEHSPSEDHVHNWLCEQEDDDGYSYCPYCGYANELGEEDYEETYENETECGSCQEIYLESIEIIVTRYTVTQRLEDKTKAQQAADELGWIVKEVE